MMRSSVIFAAFVTCVRAGILEQPASVAGWSQPTTSQGWPQKTAVDGRILPEHEKEISIIKQQLGMKEGLSLTLSGPSHLVQTVHKVRTIDQGGKILVKTRDFSFENEKDKSVIVDHMPGFPQRPIEAARFLSYDVASQALKHPLTSGSHEHIMLPSVQKEISASRIYDVSTAPQVRKYFVAPQIYKFAVVKQVPRAINVPQFFKTNPQVSFPQVNNHFLVPQAVSTSPIPHVHKHIVISAENKLTFVPKVHTEALNPAIHGHLGRMMHDGLIMPQMNNRHVIHQMQKHAWLPQPQNFVIPPRFQAHKWH